MGLHLLQEIPGSARAVASTQRVGHDVEGVRVGQHSSTPHLLINLPALIKVLTFHESVEDGVEGIGVDHDSDGESSLACVKSGVEHP